MTNVAIKGNKAKLLVDGFTLDLNREIIKCLVYDPNCKGSPFVEEIVTLAHLQKVVTDSKGMVDNSIIGVSDGYPMIVEQYITFQEYLDNEFESDGKAVLQSIINRRHKHAISAASIILLIPVTGSMAVPVFVVLISLFILVLVILCVRTMTKKPTQQELDEEDRERKEGFKLKYEYIVHLINTSITELEIMDVERFAIKHLTRDEILDPENRQRIISLNNSFKFFKAPGPAVFGRRTLPLDLFKEVQLLQDYYDHISDDRFPV